MRKVRRKAGNKEKVFGCDLLEHLNASCQEVPQVLRCCSEFVEHHGIVDGIYRLSGVSSNIQKLRGEFESDGSPDLNKDLYLQDIHCVSSLCKAYFRELPNPLLTYQLYDKFAEAVAIQLEEERLVKIRDVLKELPAPHYRTLEFLMCHLVKMASYSSETNMHARNLAIVWAPNLLRSKDIEASGFNGTAAFMEVRVQSIVVEFILTHVAQLFPDKGVALERRKSLPSPSVLPGQEEGLFKSILSQTPPNIGNISPGDGPLAIRPYHAIIESTDKRKGSLKGRKWMSIFNIGGRFPDPRRRHKHSAKEKDRSSLRPARSMDSLSTPSYPNKGSRLPAEASSSSDVPISVAPPPQGAEVGASTGGIGASEYSVTYRRGTGLVGGGTQGTYTALDPEGLGGAGGEQTRSPGQSSKAGRRAAMHITGPTLVSVPLHITSNLAFGVLQGGGGDRVILRGRDKDRGDKVEGKELGKKAARKESKGVEKKTEEVRKEDGNLGEKVTGGEEVAEVDGEEEKTAGKDVKAEQEEREEEEEEEARERSRHEEKLETEERCQPRQKRVKSVNSNKGEDNDEVAMDADVEDNEYMEMKMVEPIDVKPKVTDHGGDSQLVTSGILNSTAVEGDDQELSGYVEDSFDFLDQMDCSVLDHMDCSVSHQINEFSVEPPGHSDDEYEFMEQAQPPQHPAEAEQQQTGTEANSQNQSNSHRPLSLDIPNRHTKSLSLPHMTSPIHGPEESSSEEEVLDDNSEDEDYSSEDEESMFYKSLPSDFILNSLSGPDTDDELGRTRGRLPVHLSHSSHLIGCDTLEPGPAVVDLKPGETTHEEDKDRHGTEEMTKEEDETGQLGEQHNSDTQSSMTEEHLSNVEDAQHDDINPSPPETTHCSVEVAQSQTEFKDGLMEEGKEEEDDHTGGDLACDGIEQEIIEDDSGDFYNEAAEHLDSCVSGDEGECDEEEGRKPDKELENVTERKESTLMEPTGERSGETAEENPEETVEELGEEHGNALCETKREIWDELEEVVCEVIEDEEGAQKERSTELTDGHTQQEEEEQTVKVSEEEQMVKVPVEIMGNVEEDEATCKKVEVEVVEEHNVIQEENLPKRELEINKKDAGEACGVVEEHKEIQQEENLPKRELEINEKDAGEACGVVEEHKEIQEENLPKRELEIKEKDAGEACGECDGGNVEDNDKNESEKIPVLRLKAPEKDAVSNEDGLGGVGSRVVTSKRPPVKVYQVKAVPVVPPKPQHCKITALTIRQQQQQQQRENAMKAHGEQERATAADTARDSEDEGRSRRAGERDRERQSYADEDANRSSPLSMCFDEAVAIATMRREKEKECERERQRDRGGEA